MTDQNASFKIYNPGDPAPVFAVMPQQHQIRHPLTFRDYLRAWWRGEDAVGRVETITKQTVGIRSDMIADGSISANAVLINSNGEIVGKINL